MGKKKFCIILTLFPLFLILIEHSILFSLAQTSTRITVRGSGDPVPRFVSLRDDEAYMRKGPSKDREIAWVYKRKGLPLKIISEFEVWRKVIDSSGTTGWMHQSLLSDKRTAEVIKSILVLRKKPDLESEIVARAEVGALLNIIRCDKSWCRLNHEKITGWALRDGYYGLLNNEFSK